MNWEDYQRVRIDVGMHTETITLMVGNCKIMFYTLVFLSAIFSPIDVYTFLKGQKDMRNFEIKYPEYFL